MKSDVRNPKSERNPKPEARSPKVAVRRFGFRISAFGFLSDFRLRISDFSFILFLLVRLPNSSGAESPLADAVEIQNRVAIRTLIKDHADANAPQADGMTALHW